MSIDRMSEPKLLLGGAGATRSVGDLLHWRGHRFEILDVAPLAPGYSQVVLGYVDCRRLPISLPASDLTDATPL